MIRFTYNDMTFSVVAAAGGWTVSGRDAQGKETMLGVGLFAGISPQDVEVRARVLARTVFPVGVRCVGPDIAHPARIGDLKIVPPDVAHPNFIYWEKDSVSPGAPDPKD